MARGKAPWSKFLGRDQIPRKRSNLQSFLGKRVSSGNRRLMNPTVCLDLRDFFLCKRYGHLMGWSMPVDLGHDVLDLGYDIMGLGYDVLDKNKKVFGRRLRQIPRQNVEVKW
jgi:hypothetical protein